MKSLEELRVIRERMQGTVAYRSEHESLEEAAASEHGKYRTHVLVCGGTGCTSSGSQKIRERLDEDWVRSLVTVNDNSIVSFNFF